MIRRTPARRSAALLAPLLLVAGLGLAGCAPEAPEDMTEQVEGESTWGGGAEEGPGTEKTAELPASFPLDLVPLPADAPVDDAGERSATTWFAVLRYDSAEAANAALDALQRDGNFAITADESSLPGERLAELETASVRVSALVQAAPDGAGALLNLDVTALL